MTRSRLFTLVLIFIAVSSLALRPFPAQGVPNYGPGVKPGDEVTYGRFNFTSNLPYPIFPAHVSNLKLQINTVDAQAKDVDASVVFNFQNGTQQTQELFGNTATGTGTLFPYLVAGNLTSGDLLSNSPNQYSSRYVFNETVQRQYAGAVRTVNLLNLTISQPFSYQRIVFYWDTLTGMLLEASEHSNYNGTSSAQIFSIYFETTSTNIWSPSSNADFSFDAASITTEIVHAGETALFQLDMSSVNGLTGMINITAAPTIATSKLSIELDRSTVTLSSTTTNAGATLRVSASKTTPVGLYTISVNATTGSITHSDFLLVAVAPPDFIITANPASLTLPEGTTTTSTLTVTGRGGFNGTIGIQEQQNYGGSQVNVMISNPFVTVNATNPTATTLLTIDATFALPGTTQIFLSANTATVYRNLNMLVNVTGPDFRLTSIPASLTLAQDQSVQATIQVTSILGFKGVVALTSSSYGIYGITTSLGTSTVNLTPGGNANTTLTVTAPPGLSPGQYTLYVSGQDTRGASHQVFIPVTVTGPDFTVSIDRPSATLRQGQNANFTLTLSSVERFNGTITITDNSYGSILTTITPTTLVLDTTHTTVTAKITVTAPPGAIPSQYNEVNIQASNGIVQHYTFISINIIGPAFTINANPGLLSLSPGETGTSSLTLSSIENFTGTVSLTASTPGPGPISTIINPASVNLTIGGTASANVTVGALPGTLPGYYYVNIQATSGPLTQSTSISVDVVGPDFTFSSFPTTLTIKEGQSEKTTVSMQSLENFTGTITLVTYTFYGLLYPPNTTTINLAKGSTAAVQLQFTAALNATPGSYSVQLQAFSGSILHYVYITIRIVGPDFSIIPSPQNLTLKQGDSAQSTLFVNSIDGFAGNITVITSAYGINVTPTNTTLTLAAGQSTNTTINIQVPTSAPLQGYYISIDAYSGFVHRYSSIFVSVIGPDFNLLVLSYQQTIQAGTSTAATIQLTSLQGFTGNITLTAIGYGANATGGSIFVRLSHTRVSLSPGGSATAIVNVTTTKAAAGTNLEIAIAANSTNLTHYAYVFITIIGPSFSLSANTTFLTLAQGSSATDSITATSIDNFSGQVNLTATSQYGLTATISPENLMLTAGGTASSILTISAGSLSGYFSILVTGASGNQTRSLYINVQVENPDFFVQTNPSYMTIQAGKSALSTIQLTSLNGYHGNITLKTIFINGNGTASSISVRMNPLTVHLTAGGSASAIANITAPASAVGFNFISIQATDGNLTHYAYIYVNVVGPVFGLTANPYSLTVPQGGTGTSTITTSSIDNFTGTVHLSVRIPFPYTASLSPENVTLTSGGSTNSTLTFSVTSSTAPGYYILIVTGTRGNITRSVNISVTVTAVGTFSITANPSFLLIPLGGTGQSTVTLYGMGGFAGPVVLSATSYTPGIIATLNPESITLNSTNTSANSTVTITLPNNTTTTFNFIQIYATGNGVTQLTAIDVEVQAPDFFIIAQPTNMTIRPPGAQTVQLEIVGTGGFNQTLHFFALPQLQTGVITVTFDHASVTITPSNRVANVTATISVARYAAIGVWEVDLWAYYNITSNPGQISGHFAQISLDILPTPDFVLNSFPYVATLYQGTSTIVNSTLQSTYGFSGKVDITTTAPFPPGISASPSSLVIQLSANQTVGFNMSMSVARSMVPGIYVFKIDATTSGEIARETQILVIVRTRPDFTISPYPGSLIVQTGRQGISSITVTSLNFFNSTVALSTSGAPPGVSASISPSSIQPLPFGQVSATLNITTTATAKPGTYTINITGNSTWGAHTANVTLVVIPPLHFSVTQTQWTHRLSLSKGNVQTFTATIKNTGSNPGYIQLLAAGNATSSSLFFNAKTLVTTIDPGQTITLTFITQPFSSSSIGQKYNLVLQFIYGTMIDLNGNIVNPTMITAAQGNFSVGK